MFLEVNVDSEYYFTTTTRHNLAIFEWTDKILEKPSKYLPGCETYDKKARRFPIIISSGFSVHFTEYFKKEKKSK
jgi:hypothetical protein